MTLFWLVACLGTYNAPGSDIGPYRLQLPEGVEPVELGSTKRASMFLARYRSPAPAPDQQIILSRPTRVSDTWSDGPLPPSAVQVRAALMPLQYTETTWLGGPATLGELTSPEGVRMFMWAAVRDGWLHELQCSVGKDDEANSCQKVADSVTLVGEPVGAFPLPDTTRPEAAPPLTIPTPTGWLRAPAQPELPERLLQAAPPPPTDPRGARQLGHLAVELFPDVRKLGMWVDELRKSYAQGGQMLINQQTLNGPHGEAFRCEYSDGLTTTVTFDSLTSLGMLHVECTDDVTRRNELAVLCSRIHQGIAFDAP